MEYSIAGAYLWLQVALTTPRCPLSPPLRGQSPRPLPVAQAHPRAQTAQLMRGAEAHHVGQADARRPTLPHGQVGSLDRDRALPGVLPQSDPTHTSGKLAWWHSPGGTSPTRLCDRGEPAVAPVGSMHACALARDIVHDRGTCTDGGRAGVGPRLREHTRDRHAVPRVRARRSRRMHHCEERRCVRAHAWPSLAGVTRSLAARMVVRVGFRLLPRRTLPVGACRAAVHAWPPHGPGPAGQLHARRALNGRSAAATGAREPAPVDVHVGKVEVGMRRTHPRCLFSGQPGDLAT